MIACDDRWPDLWDELVPAADHPKPAVVQRPGNELAQCDKVRVQSKRVKTVTSILVVQVGKTLELSVRDVE